MGRKSRWNWLKEFKTVQKWLKKVRVEKTGSKATESIYLKRFGPFSLWMEMTPDKLIAEAACMHANFALAYTQINLDLQVLY